MKKLPFILLFIIAAAFAANAQDRCFKNDGLKTSQTVSFKVTGATITGTFVISAYDDSEPERTFEFTGIKTGTRLTVEFKGKAPYELRPGLTKHGWTLGAKQLRIPTYGQNYQTGKYSSYVAVYDKCENM